MTFAYSRPKFLCIESTLDNQASTSMILICPELSYIFESCNMGIAIGDPENLVRYKILSRFHSDPVECCIHLRVAKVKS